MNSKPLPDGTAVARGDYESRWTHVKYKYLIFVEKDYIVYLDNDDDVDWETSVEYDERGHKNEPKHNNILIDAAFLESTPCDGVRADRKRHFKRLIGEAIARSLGNDYSSAEKMLSAADHYISARNLETSRFWYLSATAVATFPFLLGGCILWIWRTRLIDILGFTPFWLTLSAVAGSVGALLSVASRAGQLKFDSSAGRTLHFLEAASRIVTGALSGLIVAIAVRSEIILAPLSRGHKMTTIMILAALGGGAAERLATSIISSLSTVDTKHADKELTEQIRKEASE
jgi:hypothetical protein